MTVASFKNTFHGLNASSRKTVSNTSSLTGNSFNSISIFSVLSSFSFLFRCFLLSNSCLIDDTDFFSWKFSMFRLRVCVLHNWQLLFSFHHSKKKKKKKNHFHLYFCISRDPLSSSVPVCLSLSVCLPDMNAILSSLTAYISLRITWHRTRCTC